MTKNDLIQKIRNSFPDNEIAKGTESLDMISEAYEELHEFWGKRWSDFDIDMFDRNPCVFTFVDDRDIAKILGGYMIVSLETGVGITLAFERATSIVRRKGKVLSSAGFGHLIAQLNEIQVGVLAQFIGYWLSQGNSDIAEMLKEPSELLEQKGFDLKGR